MGEKKQVKAVKSKDIKILIAVIAILFLIISALVVLIILDANGLLYQSSKSVVIEPPVAVGDSLTDGDYEYRLLEDGGVIITSFFGVSTEVITIPSELGGYSVRAIGELSISSTDGIIKEIRLPEGVTYIAKGAFSGIENAELYLPSTIEQIADYALYGFENPVGIYFAGSKEEWKRVKIGIENKVLAIIVYEK